MSLRAHRPRTVTGVARAAVAATAAIGIAAAPAPAGGPAPNCPADLDGSGEVGFDDLLTQLNAFGPDDPGGDVDGDGDTDFQDVLALLNAFGPCPPPGPVIDDVQPRQAGPGEIVEVFGAGFGDDPEDICMGAGNVSFRVLEARDDRIRAVLLPFDPGLAVPAPIDLAIGEGIRAVPGGNFQIPDEIALQEPTWCWQQPPDGPVALGPFTFVPVPPSAGDTEVFPSMLEGGDLFIDLGGVSWELGDKIRIVARAWCPERHIDCTLPTLRLLAANPSPEQCAGAICFLIEQAYLQLGEEIDCTVEDGPRIRLSYPDCDIEDGISLTSLVARTPCPIDGGPPLEVFELITHGEVEEGEVVSIVGRGFPGPLDLCVQFMGGWAATPLTVIGDRLLVETGPIPPGAQPGPVMVARGRGTFVQPEQLFVPGIEILGATDGFQGIAGPPEDFVLDLPVPPGKSSADTFRFVFDPDQRALVLQLDGDWEPGDTIRIDVHFDANLPDGTVRHFDCFAEDVQIPKGADPDPNACAQAICAIITQTFANQSPPVDVECDVNGATIIVRTPAIGQLKGGGGTVRRIP